VAPPVAASWASRAGALAVDIGPGAAVLSTSALVALAVPLRGVWWWVCVSVGAVAILLTAFNRLFLPPLWWGRSLGRAVFDITVVRTDRSAVGSWWLLMRDVAHLVDTAPMFAGWLWPLWDRQRRTFADMLLRTESNRFDTDTPVRDERRLATGVALTAAMLCAFGAVMSFAVVYRCDRAIAKSAAEIGAQGPHIVEEILSYHPQSVQADFDRARSLASDTYRAQLSALQQSVREAGPVGNEYWVTNSSVLTADSDRATMLLFLHGRRGAPPNQRHITATVRVSFVQLTAGWRVDGLVVITKPQPAEAKP
jgi:Mce-associated membrane protein